MCRELTCLVAGMIAWPLAALAGPRLEVAAASHDFGRLSNVASAAHTFVLRNAGDAELRIDRVEAGCDACVRTTLERQIVPSGGQTALRCELNLRAAQGAVARTVKVVAGGELLTLNLAANVVLAYQPPAREVLPAELVFEAKAEPQTRIIWLRQHGAQPVALADVIAPSDKFRCEVEPDPSTPSYRVYVTARDLHLPVGQGASLVLKLADDSRLTVPLVVNP